MPIKTTMRYHHTPIRMAKIKIVITSNASEGSVGGLVREPLQPSIVPPLGQVLG